MAAMSFAPSELKSATTTPIGSPAVATVRVAEPPGAQRFVIVSVWFGRPRSISGCGVPMTSIARIDTKPVVVWVAAKKYSTGV